MRTFAIACYAAAFLAESAAFALIVKEVCDTRRALQEWKHANPSNHGDGSWGQQLLINKVVSGLLGSTRRRVVAAVLVGLGIIAGTGGNFLSLPSA